MPVLPRRARRATLGGGAAIGAVASVCGVPTSATWGLQRDEVASTAAAVVISSACYLLLGDDYLARGVVGDSLGFAVLGAALLFRGRRLRHEALWCLAGIGVVHAIGVDWPLRLSPGLWWAVVAADLLAYLALRWLLLGRAHA